MELGKRIALCSLAITVLLPLGCARKAETVARPFPKAEMVPPRVQVEEEAPEEEVVVGRRPRGITEEDLAAKRRAEGVRTLAEEAEEALRNVYFAFDSSDLTAKTRRTLVENSAWLKARPGIKLQIEGHCDERGTNEYNLALGERRASSVRRYLESLGIHSNRISIISYGEERPADPGHSEEAWAKNRRAAFKVSQR